MDARRIVDADDIHAAAAEFADEQMRDLTKAGIDDGVGPVLLRKMLMLAYGEGALLVHRHTLSVFEEMSARRKDD
jgi:hypothetical protein